MKLRAVAVALALAALGAVTWRYHQARMDQDLGRRILAQSLTAGEHVALEGTQIVEAPGQPAGRAHIVQTADGRMRLEYLSGLREGAKIWDDGRKTWRWYPRKKVLAISACRRRATVLDGRRTGLLLQNFVPRWLREDLVAGQRVDVIDVRPRQPGAAWKRLWISKANHAILATSTFAPDGQTISRVRFENVLFQPAKAVDAAGFRAPVDLVRRYGRAQPGDSPSTFSPRELVDVVDFPVRVPSYLPPGYSWEAGYPFPCSCGQQAARMQFTDGLNTIVLLECGHKCSPGSQCVLPPGSSHLVARLDTRNMALAATGDVRPAELMRMLRSAAVAAPVAYPKNPRPLR